MDKSSIPIIDHIPHFLDYCKRVGLSNKTQETCKRFLILNRFILWLKKEDKNTLLPHYLTIHDLTIDDIEAYKLYLAYSRDRKNHPLKKKTQNYYLIALRALLSYFTLNGIVSLPADKISLLYDAKREKTIKFLNLGQIEKLLSAPNTKTIISLRDRVILETLISTGLKVNQLRNLDRDQTEIILSRKVSLWIKKYLKTRNDDKEKALFINYKGPRNSIGGRLTARSIESIVKRYGEIISLPFSITPEILRWARAFALSNKVIRINKPQTHKILKTKNYRQKEVPMISFIKQEVAKTAPPTWNTVENIIDNEIIWLKNNIPVLPETYKKNPSFLKYDELILRKLAILIVSGKVKATEFRAKNNKDLWNNLTEKLCFKKINRHGQEWHKKMMDAIYEYFKLQKCKLVLEPILNYGRADLGIHSNSNKTLYIEVGTVSLFKLWYNLLTMKNVTFLIVPSENKVIEFNT